MAFKTGTDLIDEARQRIAEVTPQEVIEMHRRGDDAVYLDIREANEWNLGHLPRAMHMPRGILETHVEGAIPRTRKVVIYCASGNRSALAADTMQQMGYADVSSMARGFRGWCEDGGDVDE